MAAVENSLAECEVLIATAAVADYRPEDVAADKIKKSAHAMVIKLIQNPDIVATVAEGEDRPFTVGFAAETNSLEAYARDKLVRKNLDMIVANNVATEGTGFNADDNEGTIYWPGGELALSKTSKANMARQIIAVIAQRIAGT